MQHTANKIGKAERPVRLLFADSNYHCVHNGFQYIHYEYNCQCMVSCYDKLNFLTNLADRE